MDEVTLIALLHSLGIDEENLSAVVLLPLVEVAWADGRIQAQERALIEEKAADLLSLDGEGARLLEDWLRFRPNAKTLARARHVVAALGSRPERERIPSVDEIVPLCEAVAKAAGGLFNRFFTVTASERAAIRGIAETLAEPGTLLPRDLLPEHRETEEDEEDQPTEITQMPLRVEETAAVTEERVDTGPPRGPTRLRLKLDGERMVVSPETPSLSVGRHSENDLVLHGDGEISRRHCRFLFRDGRWYVVDCASSNGTWVSGQRILERRLLGGEEITVGGSKIRVELEG